MLTSVESCCNLLKCVPYLFPACTIILKWVFGIQVVILTCHQFMEVRVLPVVSFSVCAFDFKKLSSNNYDTKKLYQRTAKTWLKKHF